MEKDAPYRYNRVTKITPRNNGINLSGAKEQVLRYDFIAPNPSWSSGSTWSRRYSRPINVKVWMSRSVSASVVYASVWAESRDGSIFISGYGTAGGGGYHKVSAAIDEAFDSAGIEMLAPFNGYGDEATEHAIAALAKRLGWKTGEVMPS